MLYCHDTKSKKKGTLGLGSEGFCRGRETLNMIENGKGNINQPN